MEVVKNRLKSKVEKVSHEVEQKNFKYIYIYIYIYIKYIRKLGINICLLERQRTKRTTRKEMIS